MLICFHIKYQNVGAFFEKTHLRKIIKRFICMRSIRAEFGARHFKSFRIYPSTSRILRYYLQNVNTRGSRW